MDDVISMMFCELVKRRGDLRSGCLPAAAVIGGGAMVQHEVQMSIREGERDLVWSEHRAGEGQQATSAGCPDQSEEGEAHREPLASGLPREGHGAPSM